MSLFSLITWAANGALKAVNGSPASDAPNPLSQIAAVVGALDKVCSDVSAGNLTLTDTFTLVNAIQAVLVDAGVEPAPLAELSKLGEAVLPMILEGYRSGAIKGGIPAWYPPGGGPGTQRGR
jgi:hypothetical protein